MASNEIVTWHRSYSVNIPLIDSQHKELIDWTNSLYRSCLKDRENSKNAFMRMLRAVVNYVEYHFSTEEKIMDRVKYPDYSNHKREHNDFVREILRAADDLSRGVKYNPLSFVTYLKDWVLTHIAVSDKALGQYLTDLRRNGELYNISLKVKQVSDRYVFA